MRRAPSLLRPLARPLCIAAAVLVACAVAPPGLAQGLRPPARAPAPSAAPGAKHHPPGGPAGILLLAAGDLRGEIKPCGCSPEGQMGGLPRRLTYLDQTRAQAREPLLNVDLGNNFPDPSPQGRLKVEFIQTVLKRARLDAILPGPNEVALGLPALDPALPWVVSNSPDPTPLAQRRIVNLAGRRRVAILGYLSPQEVYQGGQTTFRLDGVDAALLARWKADLKRESATAVVLLFRGGDAELAALMQSDLFNAIVAGNPSADELKQVTTRNAGGVTVPQVPTKGQGMLRLRVGSATRPPAADVDWLAERYADHPEAVAAMAAYDEQVKALFFQQVAAAESHRQATPYAGAEACKDCHLPAYAIWQTVRHSQALADLQKVGKQFDPECLACHVAGLGRGGYISQEATPELANVQCENCHGPGKAHVAQPTVKLVPPAGATPQGRPSEATCRTCHMGSHSPKFDFATYWPKILHGGEGFTHPPLSGAKSSSAK